MRLVAILSILLVCSIAHLESSSSATAAAKWDIDPLDELKEFVGIRRAPNNLGKREISRRGKIPRRNTASAKLKDVNRVVGRLCVRFPMECCRRGLDSVAMFRAENIIRAVKRKVFRWFSPTAQRIEGRRNTHRRPSQHKKSEKHQCCDKQKRHHEGPVRPRFNHTHCRRPDLERCVSCYRSFVKFSFRTSKLVRQSASISRAISSGHETLELLPRQRKFPLFEQSLSSIARQAHATGLPSLFRATTHSWPRTEFAPALVV